MNFASIDALKFNTIVRKSHCLPAKKLLYFSEQRKEIYDANGHISFSNWLVAWRRQYVPTKMNSLTQLKQNIDEGFQQDMERKLWLHKVFPTA